MVSEQPVRIKFRVFRRPWKESENEMYGLIRCVFQASQERMQMRMRLRGGGGEAADVYRGI